MKPEQTQSSPVSQSHGSVCGSVLQKIKTGNIKPRSRWFFNSRECVIWFFWLVTVLIGGVGVAVTLYVSMSVPYMLYEATHQNILTASISMLPYIWITIFVLMAYLAIVNLRYTKRGYRYRTVELLGSSVVVSVLLGISLQVAGQGYVMDHTLGSWIAAYPSYEKKRFSLWQAPTEGRMIGTLLPLEETSEHSDGEQQFVFHDIDERVWQVDVSELGERDLAFLHENGAQRVRVLGTSTAPQLFHLCGVFAWRSDERMTREALQNERTAFLQSLRAHVDSGEVELSSQMLVDTGIAPPPESTVMADPSRAKESGHPCRDIAAVERVEHLLVQ